MNYLLLSILTPLMSALLILLIGRRVNTLCIPIFSIISVFLSFFFSLFLLINASSGVLQETIITGLPNYPLKLIATPLTTILLTMVTLISSFVMIYAQGYMKEEKDKIRFYIIILLFITAMQTLVVAGDWILLLSAWELIGLTSYLLIGFWFQKTAAKKAASRAFLVTRTADLGLYLAIFILIKNTGTSEIQSSLENLSHSNFLVGILLLLAAMGKSAQTPMHDWLQRAMSGPTPVSALLHSATLVAAGAILLIRVSPMLSADVLFIVALVGGITIIITGLIAVGETDLKRLLAASTSSQYGLMFLAIGSGFPIAALLHLLAHSVIKSSLFMAAGVFQHSRNDTKFSTLQGVGRERPMIFIGFVIAALALTGIPPLSGFFSKDAIITATFISPHSWIFAPFALIGALLTGAYMAKAIKSLWTGLPQPTNIPGLKSMGFGFGILVILAITLGLTFKWIESTLQLPLELNKYAMIFGVLSAVTGLFLGWFFSANKLLGPIIKPAQSGFSMAGGIDSLVVRPTLAMAGVCNKFENVLYRFVLSLGKIGADIIPGICNKFETLLILFVWNVGRSTTQIAQISKNSDDRGIDKFIYFLVRMFIKISHFARAIQSGLIHRELAISVIVTAGIIVTLLIVI